MKSKYSVIFFGRKNDFYSKKVLSILKKNFLTIKTFWIDKNNKKKRIEKKFFKKDILISYRSYYIFKKKELDLIKKIAINFHPGPPKYRGYGCANYAIYNQDKTYGVTCHIINSKIDKGKIIDVNKFKISQLITLDDLLKKTYKCQISQVKKVIKKLKKSKFEYKNYKKLFPYNEIWSKKLGTKKKLDDFYMISKKLKKEKFLKIIQATNNKNYKPYLNIFGKKFTLNSE